MERVVIQNDAAKHVQAYLDYCNIVGNADHGQLMSEKEFEEYKNKVRESRKNRLYVAWRNTQGQDCKTVGPSSSCFCGHRYKEHFFDNIVERKIYCRATKCPCKMFDYVPVFGSQDLKCLCKHSYKEHNPNNKKCKRAGCKCVAFNSKHGDSCGLVFNDHETVFESREEREASGRPVDPKWMQENNMVAGMGGLTQGFSDLAEGQDKADMMSQNAIMSNLEGGNMLMGQQMKALSSGQNKKAIQGRSKNSNQNQVAKQQQPNMGTNALVLFSTPHQYQQASSQGTANALTNKMSRLKMK